MDSSFSRRDFLKAGGIAAATAAWGSSSADAAEPTLGLIFPPLNYPIPPDAKRLYRRVCASSATVSDCRAG